MILPAGEVIERKKVKNASIASLLPKKRWFYLKIFSSMGKGWAIFEDRKRVLAAYFQDGFSDYFGSMAAGRIAQALKDCEIEVGLLGKVAELFVAMHPEVKIDGEVESVFVEARVLDAIDAAVGRISVDMFTEEWEEGRDVAETAQVDLTEKVEKCVEEKTEKTVANFEEFVYSLKDFTGICRGFEGDFEAIVYIKGGEVVGAIVRDGELEIKGEAALFYLDRPLEVEVKECDVEVPDEAKCGESERSVETLYAELDRRAER